ncbi:MAG TPA: hypothetical protein VHM70_10410 [Polyangiaceae bacterium]|nr:hypothetical protein [Polyangiaceae bacterium]
MLTTSLLISSKPQELATRCVHGIELRPLARATLTHVLICTGVFGFVLGSSRGVSQAFASAVKLPLAWIITLSVCAPAFYAITAVFGQGIRLRSLLALLLSATARASLVLFALLPVLWFSVDILQGSATGYHQLTMIASLLYGAAGLAGLGVVVRALQKRASSLPILAGFALTFCLVAGQTAWSLRPFVGRPAETTTPWFRPAESTFLEALMLGSDSARGIYHSSGDYEADGRETGGEY